jgi:hypothetical protein
MLRPTLPLLGRERAVGIDVALKLIEEGGAGFGGRLAGIVRGVQPVRTNATAPAHLGRVELQGNENRVS